MQRLLSLTYLFCLCSSLLRNQNPGSPASYALSRLGPSPAALPDTAQSRKPNWQNNNSIKHSSFTTHHIYAQHFVFLQASMVLPADVCMPNNQDFPDLFETFGRFSVDQIYWIHFLKIQMFFETVSQKTKQNQQKIIIRTVVVFHSVLLLFSTKC